MRVVSRKVQLRLASSLWLMCAALCAGEQPPAVQLRDVKSCAQISGFPDAAKILANSPGICLDLGCGDGTLSAELVSKTKFYVFAIARTEADCEQARAVLDKTGCYGTRATAVASSLKRIPVPDHYGNLIVSHDGLRDLDLREVFRALNPNGTAIIGGGDTDPVKLKAAVDATGIKDCVIEGNYAVFKGKMPDGSDDWTHFGHGPDNIQTSLETGIRPPFTTQWYLAQPSYDDKATDHAAIAGGRIVCRPAVPRPDPDRYYAFDAFNGTMLWNQPVARSKNNYRYALVDGVVYWTEGDRIVALDVESGERLREYSVPDVKGSFWWLAVHDNVLYGLESTATVPPSSAFGVANFFCAFDLKTHAPLWKKDTQLSVISWTVALDGAGGIFFCSAIVAKDAKAAQGTIYCLDAKTGEERWHKDAGLIAARYSEANSAGCIDGKYFVWVCQDDKGIGGTKSFDCKTGEMVRDYPGVRSWAEGLTAAVNFIDGKMYTNPRAGHEPYSCHDVATGEKLTTKIDELRARDCVGHASATCLYTGGESACVQDLLSGKEFRNPFIRPGDFTSSYPANGLLFHFPSVCHCAHMFGAPVALAPAGLDWKPPEADKDLDSRLLKGPAFDAPAPDDADAEWSHYRGNAGHTGETSTDPKGLKPAWERKLEGRLTPPSFGAGLVFVGSRKGIVWALERGNGNVRWRFLCGACVRVTPTFANGRLIFGSDDGFVYCLEATTGRLAWRFRAAPDERYINAEGQMNSLWPSTAGVIVEKGTAYCAAGLLSYDGGYLYALDLKTGAVKWAKRIGGPDLLQGAPHGIMALAGDRLILPVFACLMNSAYQKTTGERLEWCKGSRSYWVFGSEAIADGDAFFYGGIRHGEDAWRGGHAPYTLMDTQSGWPYGKWGTTPDSLAARNIAPVLGTKKLLGDGAVYDREKFCAILKSDQPAKAKGDALIGELPFWENKTELTSSLVLAGDVAIAAGRSQIVAIEAKKDGRLLGRVTLPGTLRRNSLAASGGNIFVVTEESSIHCIDGAAETDNTGAQSK